MIKTYVKESKNSGNNEVKIINLETGAFTQYNTDGKIGFPFGNPYNTTVFEMGYKSVNDCLKTLKERNFLGYEADYRKQKESEMIGLINLGSIRIENAGRINSNDFEDITLKLSDYGLGYVDAQNQIIANYMSNK